ncbi:hypothetical protein DVH24_033559, partial [Malus domestica]
FTVGFTLFQDPSGFVHQHLAPSVRIDTKSYVSFLSFFHLTTVRPHHFPSWICKNLYRVTATEIIDEMKLQSATNSQISPPLPADTTMTIDPNHTTASAAANMATVGAAAHNTTTTRLVRPAVSSHLLSNLYTAPSFQIRTQWPSSSPAAANHQGVLYPLASSGRSFIHRLIRPTAAAGQPEMNPHSLWPTPELCTHLGAYSISLLSSLFLLAPSLLPHPIRGIPRSSTPPEVAQSSVPDSNGFKDMMDKSKDDNLAIIRGRKVRMTDGASPYGWSYPPIDLRRQRRKDGTPTSHSPNLTNRKSSHQSELSILR